MQTSKSFFVLRGLLLSLPVGLLIGLGAANSALAQTDTGAAPPAAPSKATQRAQDHSLRKAVRHALVHTQRLDQSHITIGTHSGHVTLEGSVPDEDQIQLAVAAAQGVPGVTNVANDLHLDEPGR